MKKNKLQGLGNKKPIPTVKPVPKKQAKKNNKSNLKKYGA